VDERFATQDWIHQFPTLTRSISEPVLFPTPSFKVRSGADGQWMFDDHMPDLNQQTIYWQPTLFKIPYGGLSMPV
jgi:hypothetical protein